ncbi:MAG: hypothetical protein HZC38_09425 [Chloroflexi bacterium]|nr:hypothetical protein [Chloroflexota bacterium]
MADISALFGIFLALGIAFPGMLTAWWLLFPASVERARLRLERTPWKCFFAGGLTTAIIAIPIVILLVLPFGPTKFIAWSIIFIALTFASLGASGIAAKMGERLASRAHDMSAANAFVRGAIALELAAAFPIIGWFIVIPLTIVTAMGATVFALLRWIPKTQQVVVSEEASLQNA